MQPACNFNDNMSRFYILLAISLGCMLMLRTYCYDNKAYAPEGCKTISLCKFVGIFLNEDILEACKGKNCRFGSAIISAKLKIPRDILYANERNVGQQKSCA